MNYEIGEIAEVKVTNQRVGCLGWCDCEIIAFGNPENLKCTIGEVYHYTVNTPSVVDPLDGSSVWLCKESDLRKKRPPQQDSEVAEEHWIEDFKRAISFKEPVEDKV